MNVQADNQNPLILFAGMAAQLGGRVISNGPPGLGAGGQSLRAWATVGHGGPDKPGKQNMQIKLGPLVATVGQFGPGRKNSCPVMSLRARQVLGFAPGA